MIIEKPGVYEAKDDAPATVLAPHLESGRWVGYDSYGVPRVWLSDGQNDPAYQDAPGDKYDLTRRIGDLPGEANRPEKCQPPAIHVEVSGIVGIGKTGVVRIIRDALLKHARVGVILEPDYSEAVDLAGPPEPTTPVYITERAIIPGDLPGEEGTQVPVEDVRQMRDDDYWHGYDAGYEDGYSGKQKRERKGPETFADLPGEDRCPKCGKLLIDGKCEHPVCVAHERRARSIKSDLPEEEADERPQFIIAPEGCAGSFTVGESYEVLDRSGIPYVQDDDGDMWRFEDGCPTHTAAKHSMIDWVIPDDEQQPAPLKIEPGKSYRTRAGERFICGGRDPEHDDLWIGRIDSVAAIYHTNDLIAEWREEPETEPADFPAGAIHNGRARLARLADDYDFECGGGPLKYCIDYQEAVRCFEHLAQWAEGFKGKAGETK